MRQSVKITIQNEKTKRVLLSYVSNHEVEDTTISSELKKQIRETISYPCEEFSQTLWNDNKEVKDEQVIPNNSKLEYVLLIKQKERETPNPKSFW
jgi:hypothetical protein